jgi:Oxysterol-binding protein
MDLSKVTFPTFVLEPRSMLERITDFMAHPDLIFGWVCPLTVLLYSALAALRHPRAPLTQHMSLGSAAPELTLCVNLVSSPCLRQHLMKDYL